VVKLRCAIASHNVRTQASAIAIAESLGIPIGKTYLPLINGEYVETESYIDSVNPSHPSEVVGKIGLISLSQGDEAMESAKEAFKTWSKTPVKERADILRKAGDIMEARRHELIAWMCYEVGKIIKEGDPEVSEAIDFCRYYATEMERLDRGYSYDVAGETDRYFYQPKGIALIVSPWNFPFAIATGMTVAALVAGNCALLKPAATSTVIGAKIAEILVEAGIPKGVFQYIPGKGSVVGDYLVKHPDIHLIAFTGSREVGCKIYADAAILQPKQKHLKRVIAEMGGKNAIIIDESADLDQAVAGVVQSAFGFSGQKCSACSRVIVLNSVYDSFVERLTEALTEESQVRSSLVNLLVVLNYLESAQKQEVLIDYLLQFLEPRVVTENIQRQGFAPIEGADN